MMRRPWWLLARVAAQHPMMCEVVVEELRDSLSECLVQMLSFPGAITAVESHPAWPGLCYLCGLVAHLLLAGVQTRYATDAMLQTLVSELGHVLARVLARAALISLAHLVDENNSGAPSTLDKDLHGVEEKSNHAGRAMREKWEYACSARQVLASTPLRDLIPALR